MSKNIIWSLFASKKRDEFKFKFQRISKKMLEPAEENLRINHETGDKLGIFRTTLGFKKDVIELNFKCLIEYTYIYDTDKIYITDFDWSIQPLYC
jgi:hypothetical protein